MARARRGSSRQNVASRMDLVVRREREEDLESKTKRIIRPRKRGQRVHSQNSQVRQAREAHELESQGNKATTII